MLPSIAGAAVAMAISAARETKVVENILEGFGVMMMSCFAEDRYCTLKLEEI